LVGKPLLVFIDPTQRRSFRLRLSNLDAKDNQSGLQLRLRLRTGRLRRVAASVGVVRSASGAIQELRWLLVDDTKRRRRERLVRSLNEELKARVEERTADLQRAVEVQQELARAAGVARAAAERASREKSELIAIVSHELRTPLAAISGYAELLALDIRGPLNESQRADIQRIQQAQSHIIRLVEDLVGYSKLETGRLRFDITDVLVRDAVMGLVSFVRPQGAAKEITVTVQTPDDDVVVKADEERLRQIVLNLLTNAIKFTPRGGHVSITYGGDEASAWIAISDNGIGIPPEKLEVVFEPYVQLASGPTQDTGWGLGLAISRDLARAMGGDLTVASSRQDGTVFTVRLPRSTRINADSYSG
jgi:signal transduction histidine kinase